MDVEESQDYVLLTEELAGDVKPEEQQNKKPVRRRHNGAILLILLLLLGLVGGLYFYQNEKAKQSAPQSFYVELTEEVTAKAYVWLAQIQNMPFTYEQLRELFGEVNLEITQTPTENKGVYENWIAEGSYERCVQQVNKSFLEIYRQVLSGRLQEAGYTGEVTEDALNQMMLEAYNLEVETYLEEYGPEILPSMEECAKRYAGEVTYE